MGAVVMGVRPTLAVFVVCWASIFWNLSVWSLLSSSALLLLLVYMQGYAWQSYPLLLATAFNIYHAFLHAMHSQHERQDFAIFTVTVVLQCAAFAGILGWPIPTLPPPTGALDRSCRVSCGCEKKGADFVLLFVSEGKYRVATHMDVWTVFEGQEARRMSMRMWYPAAVRSAPSNARYLFSLLVPHFSACAMRVALSLSLLLA